jgi:hypothetical protein
MFLSIPLNLSCTLSYPQMTQDCQVTIQMSLLHLAIIENRPQTLATILSHLRR